MMFLGLIRWTDRMKDSYAQVAVATMMVSFALLLHSLAPTITAGDSGELAVAACTLGVPHPPGYPLWVLVNKAVATVVPLGELGFRCALASGLCGSLGVGMVALAGCTLFSSATGGVLAGVVGMFSYTLWEQSSICEVYALNAFFVSALLATHFATSGGKRLQLEAMLVGLGVANHHTILLVAAPLGVVSLAQVVREEKRLRPISISFLALFLGATCYLATVMRANADPAMNWGVARDLEGFLTHVLRKQYGPAWSGSRSFALTGLQLKSFAQSLLSQWGNVLPWLILVGVFVAQRARRGSGFLLLAIMVLAGPLLTILLNPDLERETLDAVSVFYVPAHLVAAILIAGGLMRSVKRNVVGRLLGLEEGCEEGAHAFQKGTPPKKKKASGNRDRDVASFKRLAIKILSWAPVLLLVAPLTQNDSLVIRRRDWTAHNYAQDALRTVGRQGLLFLSSDHQSFPVAFLQFIEERSPHVLSLDAHDDPYDDPWGHRLSGKTADEKVALRIQLMEEWLGSGEGQVFTATRAGQLPPEGFRFLPYGLAYRLQQSGLPAIEPHQLWQRYLGVPADAPRDYGNDMIRCDYVLSRGVSFLEQGNISQALLAFGEAERLGYGVKEHYNNVGSMLAEHRVYDGAIRQYEKALAIHPDYAMARRNLGRVYLEAGHPEEALKQFEEIFLLSPRDASLLNDVGRAQLELGRVAQALAAWEESLKIQPEQPWVREWVSRYRTASTERHPR